MLGVARGISNDGKLPDSHGDLALELVGLLGFEDPLRPTVPAAVAECRTAGIRVVMITGDYAATAQSIARQAGLANYDSVITGPELKTMSDAQRIFHFAPIHAGDLVLSIVAGLACALWFDLLKLGKRWTCFASAPRML